MQRKRLFGGRLRRTLLLFDTHYILWTQRCAQRWCHPNKRRACCCSSERREMNLRSRSLPDADDFSQVKYQCPEETSKVMASRAYYKNNQLKNLWPNIFGMCVCHETSLKWDHIMLTGICWVCYCSYYLETKTSTYVFFAIHIFCNSFVNSNRQLHSKTQELDKRYNMTRKR